MARGVEVDETTLALDLIKEIGFAGNYLDQMHTVRHFRKEHHIPKLLVRDPYEAWEKAGSPTALDRAKDRVREILASHQPRQLDPAMVQELEAYRQMVAQRDLNDFYLGELPENQNWDAL
jgi:trimethylamine--corrinoid protein Co-methyltransferase